MMQKKKKSVHHICPFCFWYPPQSMNHHIPHHWSFQGPSFCFILFSPFTLILTFILSLAPGDAHSNECLWPCMYPCVMLNRVCVCIYIGVTMLGFFSSLHLMWWLQGTAVVPSVHLVQGCRQMLLSLHVPPLHGLISSPQMDTLVASTSCYHTHSQPYIHANTQSAESQIRGNQTFLHTWSSRTRA